MTVTSHTSCKAVMFLPKAGVYIALIIRAVNSHFVWVFFVCSFALFCLCTGVFIDYSFYFLKLLI